MNETGYKNYLLIVLLVIAALNFVDRMALGLLLQDIKLDFDLSDTQLGFLSGIAFALFYSAMGIPIARWADRGDRVAIIAITTALWSAAVALCGVAGNFAQLLLIRVGVAVGEAGCIPPAHSLIAHYFARAERPRAVAIYMLGWPLALAMGYFLAGWVNERYGWRVTFMVLGLPGLGLAALAWLTLREPRRGKRAAYPSSRFATVSISSHSNAVALASEHPSLKEVCLTLWSNRTFRHLLLCFAVAYFFGYGIGQWQPAFFIRSYGIQTAELGAWFAVIWGGGGLLGTYLGGELASRRAANNERLQLKAMAAVYCGFGVVSACIYLSPNQYVAFALMGLAAVGITTVGGPLFATIQTLVPDRMRAMSIALVYLFANLIGMGLGPLATGMLSDAIRPWAGDDSLRYALLVLSPGYLWCGWHLWRGSKTVSSDLEAVQFDERRHLQERSRCCDAEQRSVTAIPVRENR
jgi:MFS transporter, Spinster family, sphingosine-1-phosphate transporter